MLAPAIAISPRGFQSLDHKFWEGISQ